MDNETREALLNDFAKRCFRNMADRDYVHARLAYRSKLVSQFLWSSLHSLEKYAKAILLFNRVDGRGIKHEVLEALERLEVNSRFRISLSDAVKEFIGRLESTARFRYLEVSWHNMPFDVVRLDCAIWEIRRYCELLDYEIEADGVKKRMLDTHLKRIEASTPGSKGTIRFNDGWLEKILADKLHPAREPLVWNNLYFNASTRKRVKMEGYWETENAPLFLHPEILDDVSKYVFIPKDVSRAIKER